MGTHLPSSGTLGLVSGQWLGFLTPEVSLPIYTHSMWIWDYAHSASLHLSGHIYITTPLTHLGECGFYKSLVWWTSIQLDFSDYFWWYFFCILVVIFSIVIQGGERCLFTCASILARILKIFLYEI